MSKYLMKIKSIKKAWLSTDSETIIMKFGNPPRRKRPFIYKVLQSNYCEKTGDILNIYCAQKYNSKTLQYFIEICPANESDYFTITGLDLGRKNLSLRDCKNMVKKLINGR